MKALKIILGILLIIAGGYCIIRPGMTFLGIGWMLGPLLLIVGLQSIILYLQERKAKKKPIWDLLIGILTLILGCVLIYNMMTRALVDLVLAYAMGGWIAVTGLFRIISALKAEKTSWKVFGTIVGALCLIAGVYSFVHPAVAAVTTGYMIGFCVISGGINFTMAACIKDSEK